MTHVVQQPASRSSQPVSTDSRPRDGARRFLAVLLTRYPMVLALVVLLIVTTILYPRFWSGTNLLNLVTQNIGLLFCCVGMTFVIICGGFDLSVGSVYAAGAMFYISFLGSMPAPVAAVLSVLLGIVCGFVNGAVINLLRVNTFVATLGTASVVLGLITIYAGANAAFASDPGFTYIGNAKVAGFPVAGWIALAVVIVSGIVLAGTTFGRAVYAVGGNREAARLSGIRVGLVSTATFVIIGGLAAFGGVFTASQLGTATPSFVGNITLNSIAIVIIGGTALTGGDGTIWRTMIGLAIIAVVVNLFTSLNFRPELQTVFEGVIVIGAVAMDVWLIRRRRA